MCHVHFLALHLNESYTFCCCHVDIFGLYSYFMCEPKRCWCAFYFNFFVKNNRIRFLGSFMRWFPNCCLSVLYSVYILWSKHPEQQYWFCSKRGRCVYFWSGMFQPCSRQHNQLPMSLWNDFQCDSVSYCSGVTLVWGCVFNASPLLQYNICIFYTLRKKYCS